MKEKILQALKTKYASFGFGEKALDGVASYLATSITEENQIETAIAGVEGFLKVFQSESDTIRSAKAAAEKSLKEMEEKIKTLSGGKGEPKQEEDDDKNIPEWAKKLIEQNQAFSEKLNKMESEKVSTSRKSRIDEVIKTLPENLRKPYERISFENLSNDDFEKQFNEIKGEVETLSKEYKQKGSVFGVPTQANGGSNIGEELNEKEINSIAGEKF